MENQKENQKKDKKGNYIPEMSLSKALLLFMICLGIIGYFFTW